MTTPHPQPPPEEEDTGSLTIGEIDYTISQSVPADDGPAAINPARTLIPLSADAAVEFTTSVLGGQTRFRAIWNRAIQADALTAVVGTAGAVTCSLLGHIEAAGMDFVGTAMLVFVLYKTKVGQARQQSECLRAALDPRTRVPKQRPETKITRDKYKTGRHSRKRH